MAMLRLLPVLLALAVGPFGCNFIDAKPQAEAIAAQSFMSRKMGNRETTLSFYHDVFYQSTPREDWTAMLDSLQSKLGVPASHSLNAWNVFVGDGAAGPGTYVTLAYNVQYPDASGVETLVLYSPFTREDPKIIRHNINSAALLTR